MNKKRQNNLTVVYVGLTRYLYHKVRVISGNTELGSRINRRHLKWLWTYFKTFLSLNGHLSNQWKETET